MTPRITHRPWNAPASNLHERKPAEENSATLRGRNRKLRQARHPRANSGAMKVWLALRHWPWCRPGEKGRLKERNCSANIRVPAARQASHATRRGLGAGRSRCAVSHTSRKSCTQLLRLGRIFGWRFRYTLHRLRRPLAAPSLKDERIPDARHRASSRKNKTSTPRERRGEREW